MTLYFLNSFLTLHIPTATVKNFHIVNTHLKSAPNEKVEADGEIQMVSEREVIINVNINDKKKKKIEIFECNN